MDFLFCIFLIIATILLIIAGYVDYKNSKKINRYLELMQNHPTHSCSCKAQAPAPKGEVSQDLNVNSDEYHTQEDVIEDILDLAHNQIVDVLANEDLRGKTVKISVTVE